MPHGFQGAVLRAFGAKDHELTVRGVTRLAPHFIRVRFDAGTLFRQVAHEPAAWVRLWLHDPVDGNEYQRAYTISDADPDAGWLDIDFLLHEPAGPASAWAAAAEPGRRVIAQFLGSTSYAPVDGASGLLLIGDAASLPAINAILRAAPADTKIDVLLERAHAEDELIPRATHPGASVRWVDRSGAGSLASAVREYRRRGVQVWAAGETASLKALRPVLREQFGTTKQTSHVQAYWIEGRAMGTARKP